MSINFYLHIDGIGEPRETALSDGYVYKSEHITDETVVELANALDKERVYTIENVVEYRALGHDYSYEAWSKRTTFGVIHEMLAGAVGLNEAIVDLGNMRLLRGIVVDAGMEVDSGSTTDERLVRRVAQVAINPDRYAVIAKFAQEKGGELRLTWA